ncbi:MAG: molybdopterin molybdenumtransferase MoeA [Burkholderiales bacterium RIFCSPLOWO2_12_FULL_61_40]|nr:MAG: molybdopterin molybdenumtransferase MoeA [Burkholderiales bacterium RIFCSPLOWO2_12_FULL_61_40]
MNTLDEIAAQLQGYDPHALRADAATRFLTHLVQPIAETRSVHLMDALGCVVAEDVISPVDVPAHDNSAMDGYAFVGAQLTAHTPLELKVVGTALAGKAWVGTVGDLQCVKIMTGAVMPAGLDTVVPQEMVACNGETITIAADTVRVGDNRRRKGEDIGLGQPALQAGARITPAALGLLASLGVPQVRVLRRLRVAYFSTGDEILSLGEPPREGAVYDSNRYTIYGLLTRLGIDVIDMGVVQDDPVALETAFRTAASQADAIITSGGVSVGEADHTKATMRKLADGDAGVVFWKIAMRPGRPMAVGHIGKTVLFGLPGNPVAVMVTFLAFVRPALLQMMGCTPRPTPLLRARSVAAIRKKPGRTEYQRAIVTTAPDGSLFAQLTGQQGSGVLSSMVQANGLLVLAHDQGDIGKGDEVNVLMFDGAI